MFKLTFTSQKRTFSFYFIPTNFPTSLITQNQTRANYIAAFIQFVLINNKLLSKSFEKNGVKLNPGHFDIKKTSWEIKMNFIGSQFDD